MVPQEMLRDKTTDFRMRRESLLTEYTSAERKQNTASNIRKDTCVVNKSIISSPLYQKY